MRNEKVQISKMNEESESTRWRWALCAGVGCVYSMNFHFERCTICVGRFHCTITDISSTLVNFFRFFKEKMIIFLNLSFHRAPFVAKNLNNKR